MRKALKNILVLLIILSLISCEMNTEAHNHIFDDETVIKSPSCIESGEKICKCSCGETKTITMQPLDHNFCDWIIEKEATYSETGSKMRTCECGELERAIIECLKPVFEDHFDGETLNPANWELCPEWIRHDGGSIWDRSMTSLDGDGHLVLRAEWDAEKQRANCGAIRSKGLFEYGYGYYEASIKFPVVQGAWGAFWINCGNIQAVDGSAKDGVEIDVIESIFNEKGYCNSALHWDGYGSHHKEANSGRMTYDIYDGNFHLFAVDRTHLGYTFYIDGIKVWQVYSYDCAACPEPGFIILSLEATYSAGLSENSAAQYLPAEMIVDYVKVYEKNPYI